MKELNISRMLDIVRQNTGLVTEWFQELVLALKKIIIDLWINEKYRQL